MTQSEVISVQTPVSSLAPWNGWLEEIGRTRATGHRWRQQYPWLEAGIVNVFGRLYIKRETIADFERRALAGELAKDIKPEQAGAAMSKDKLESCPSK